MASIVLELPVIVSKDDLSVIARLRGDVLSRAIKSGDQTYPECSLVFLGFAGSRQDDGMYHGCYRFRDAQPSDAERDLLKIGDLPNMEIESNGGDTHTTG